MVFAKKNRKNCKTSSDFTLTNSKYMFRVNTHGWKTKMLFRLMRLIPLQNKIVATTFKGKKYGDNPQFVFESIHKINDKIKLIWLVDPTVCCLLPDYIKKAPYARTVLTIYHYATAKVVIDTHRFPAFVEKRNGQLFIETWHGGLGIKKIDGDVDKFLTSSLVMGEVAHTNNLADVFISQSDHLSRIYRSAFKYTGPIWKCGYPKNDCLIVGDAKKTKDVRQYLSLPDGVRTCLYAPSFRDYFYHEIHVDVYSVDFSRLKDSLEKRFGGEWKILVRWHPLFAKQIAEAMSIEGSVIDTTQYPDMQALLLAVDAVVSDYSSCLFDAALRNIPCFTYATDFEQYKADRGVYYEMEELPFPYARNNDELMRNVETFDQEDYLDKWEAFKARTGLHETGHSAKDIAEKIVGFLKGESTKWE